MASSSTSTLRPLTADLFVTLDGYAKGDHSPAYFGMLGPELEQWIEHEMKRPQTVVMGRKVYETLAHYDDGTGPLAKLPKIMVSRTLAEASGRDRSSAELGQRLFVALNGSRVHHCASWEASRSSSACSVPAPSTGCASSCFPSSSAKRQVRRPTYVRTPRSNSSVPRCSTAGL